MKAIYRNGVRLLMMFFLASLVNTLTAQSTKPSAEILTKGLVDSQQYIFHAQTVSPMNGRQIFLTTDYTIKVSKDTIMTDLPYFGRAYSAPINPSEGGIRFTSTSFGYKVTPRKKGGWDITIQPKDARDVQQMILTIFDNGKADLRVNSNNRQPISFNGYITGVKK